MEKKAPPTLPITGFPFCRTIASNKLKQKAKNLTDMSIMNSNIASIIGGEKISVNSAETGIDYVYELASQRCVVGLSVNEDIEFVQLNEDKSEEIKEFIVKLVEGKYKEFLEKKIYEAKECVICLEEGCDTVIFQCAHKCCHYDCISNVNKCPICRSFIKARIRTDKKEKIKEQIVLC